MTKDTRFKKGNKAAVGHKGPVPYIWTEERAEIEAKNLLEYAQKDTSLTLMGFYAESEDVDYSVSYMMEKYPVWSKAKKKAMAKIGDRREKYGLLGKYDSGIVKKAMGLYCHDFRNYEKELKAADKEAQGQTLNVKITDYSKCQK